MDGRMQYWWRRYCIQCTTWFNAPLKAKRIQNPRARAHTHTQSWKLLASEIEKRSAKQINISCHKYRSEAHLIIVLSVDFSGLSLPLRRNSSPKLSNDGKWRRVKQSLEIRRTKKNPNEKRQTQNHSSDRQEVEKEVDEKKKTEEIANALIQCHWISRLNNYDISGTTFTILNKSVGHTANKNSDNKCWNTFFSLSLSCWQILQTSAQISRGAKKKNVHTHTRRICRLKTDFMEVIYCERCCTITMCGPDL